MNQLDERINRYQVSLGHWRLRSESRRRLHRQLHPWELGRKRLKRRRGSAASL